MTCGACPHADGLCYTSMPPQCRCNITGEYHYYGDECNCNDDLVASKTEELENFKELLNRPGALMKAVNYDSDKAPAVAITGEEAAVAYTSLLNLPLYGECECTGDSKISIEPYKNTIELDKVDKQLLAPVCMYATKCLVCDTEVPVPALGGGQKVCPDCKKAIKLIKERFKEELDKYDY